MRTDTPDFLGTLLWATTLGMTLGSVAPDPAQAAFNYRVDLRTFTEPRLIGWRRNRLSSG